MESWMAAWTVDGCGGVDQESGRKKRKEALLEKTRRGRGNQKKTAPIKIVERDCKLLYVSWMVVTALSRNEHVVTLLVV